jgi:hypothetical protein
MKRCPHCGHFFEEDSPGGVTVDELKAFCRDRGIIVHAGDRVDERTAAIILDREPGTLRNWRLQARPLPYLRSGLGRGRAYYRLSDLCEFMSREDID